MPIQPKPGQYYYTVGGILVWCMGGPAEPDKLPNPHWVVKILNYPNHTTDEIRLALGRKGGVGLLDSYSVNKDGYVFPDGAPWAENIMSLKRHVKIVDVEPTTTATKHDAHQGVPASTWPTARQMTMQLGWWENEKHALVSYSVDFPFKSTLKMTAGYNPALISSKLREAGTDLIRYLYATGFIEVDLDEMFKRLEQA